MVRKVFWIGRAADARATPPPLLLFSAKSGRRRALSPSPSAFPSAFPSGFPRTENGTLTEDSISLPRRSADSGGELEGPDRSARGRGPPGIEKASTAGQVAEDQGLCKPGCSEESTASWDCDGHGRRGSEGIVPRGQQEFLRIRSFYASIAREVLAVRADVTGKQVCPALEACFQAPKAVRVRFTMRFSG